VDYNTFKPSPDLETIIKCFWTLQVPKEFEKEKQQILPDGCIEIIFNLGDDIKRYVTEDEFIIQPRSFVLGQISKPFIVEPTGLVDTFAVRFFPINFFKLINISMANLVNKETELKELFDQPKIAKLELDITQAKDSAQRIKITEAFLLDLIKQSVNIDDLLQSTIDTIVQTNGTVSINNILLDQQMQRRQLERKFSKHIGLSPKQLCRIIRLQATLKAMHNNTKGLTSVGYENHFFDQAHFIKDFKDFTGISPKEFYEDQKFLLSSVLYSKD
jgi:AraC-like DNA-binding protein